MTFEPMVQSEPGAELVYPEADSEAGPVLETESFPPLPYWCSSQHVTRRLLTSANIDGWERKLVGIWHEWCFDFE